MSGTAKIGLDYLVSGTPGQVTISAGQLSTTFTVTALKDAVSEKQETSKFTIPRGDGTSVTANVLIASEKRKRAATTRPGR